MNDSQKQQLLKTIKPIQFTDGTEVFKKFMDEYIVHDRGFFILAPSGTGKTYYVKHQTEKHWIDGDELWTATGAHPDEPWWTMGLAKINEVDQRSDVVTMYAKQLGLWIMGASQFYLKPDAIVLPEWEDHKQYIIHREQHNYDGGAKSEDFEQVSGHRNYMENLARNENIPIFQSIQDAVTALSSRSG